MATITEVGRDETRSYGVAFVVCGNPEVLRLALGAEDDDAATEAARVACRSIADSGYDYDRESDFRAYNGGPRVGMIDAIWYVADIEIEDLGDGETEEVLGEWKATWQRGAGATAIPADMLAKIEAVTEAAGAAMQTALA